MVFQNFIFCALCVGPWWRMDSSRTSQLGVIILLVQVLLFGYVNSRPCSPGFGCDLFLFRVHEEYLHGRMRIGTVDFKSCGTSSQTKIISEDTNFQLDPDGTVKLKNPVTLYNNQTEFTVHAVDISGRKYTARVRVERKDRDAEALQTECLTHFPDLKSSKSLGELVRRKREWVVPPLHILENGRGPFPTQIAQIRSSFARETKMVYAMTGEGADQPPVGVFTINNEGYLFVSKSLDREVKASYQLVITARSPTSNIFEPPMEIIVIVLDENDNRPVFTQNPFIGTVREAAKAGSEFMTVSATDADDSVNTINAELRYEITRQHPSLPQKNMFAINPVSGAIRVNAEGLDREKFSEYTLEIVATDREGAGSSTTATAIIVVTYDSPLQIDPEPSTKPLLIFFPENTKGPFPKQIGQIQSCHSKNTKMIYSITGEGANLHPQGLFTMNKDTGHLYVAWSLDRETKAKYTLQAHADAADSSTHDPPVEIIVHVTDQNDNKPSFKQDTFHGSVPEASKIGSEVMTIIASDSDDFTNTYNADIRYSIVSQNPPLPKPDMFEINAYTGMIRVDADGLDQEKYPKYTLEIEAADLLGLGFSSKAKVVITVTGHLGTPLERP